MLLLQMLERSQLCLMHLSYFLKVVEACLLLETGQITILYNQNGLETIIPRKPNVANQKSLHTRNVHGSQF